MFLTPSQDDRVTCFKALAAHNKKSVNQKQSAAVVGLEISDPRTAIEMFIGADGTMALYYETSSTYGT